MKIFRIEDKFGKGMYNADDKQLKTYACAVMYTSFNHPGPMSDVVEHDGGQYCFFDMMEKSGIPDCYYFYAFTSLEMMLRWINNGDEIDSNSFFRCDSTLSERLFASGAIVVEYDCPDDKVIYSKNQAVFVKKEATRVRELEPEEWV